LKVTGLTGLGTIVAPFNQSVKAIEQEQTMPAKPFGKSGIKVPILSFGQLFIGGEAMPSANGNW
jgi:hypothetical protein